MQQTILAIAGKPGLFKLVSRGNNNLIVEALDETHRRQPAFSTDRITSLSDIAMFTETDDVPLMDVLDSLKTLEGGKAASINEKKASGDELRAYFAKVLPEFDRERVHVSDIKKLISWYNILVKAGVTDFKEEKAKAEEEVKEEPKAEEKAEPKAAPKKEPKSAAKKEVKADAKKEVKAEAKKEPKKTTKKKASAE